MNWYKGEPMPFTIEAVPVFNGKQREPIATEMCAKRPAAMKIARRLAVSHKPKCHHTLGFLLITVHDGTRIVAWFQSWKDGEIKYGERK
jgi:hypothetical protein